MNTPKPVAAGPIPKRLQGILCLDDFEVEARRRLPHSVFEYVAGGVEDNRARESNRKAFHDWDFASVSDTVREVFGREPDALVGSVASYRVGA